MWAQFSSRTVVANMSFSIKLKYCRIHFFLLFSIIFNCGCYEKTLRKIVRNQSKMVQRPFSEQSPNVPWRNNSHLFVYPGYAQVTSIIHKMQRPKISTILSSIDTGRSKSMFSRLKIPKNEQLRPYEFRTPRDSVALQQSEHNFILDLQKKRIRDRLNSSDLDNRNDKSHTMPTSIFFLPVEGRTSPSKEIEALTRDKISNEILESLKTNENDSLFINSVFVSSIDNTSNIGTVGRAPVYDSTISEYYDVNPKRAELLIDEVSTIQTPFDNHSFGMKSFQITCTEFHEAKVDIDVQEKFSEFNIEPPCIVKKHFWNHIYENRYEALMRDPKWPSLKVILVPRSQIHTLWRQPFEYFHNNTVRRIISNMVKKLQFYPNLTFSWNEVSHLSQWWKGAHQKSRRVLRRLVEEGRLEITTGCWVETDEATSHLFGILHQLIEGHQWLQFHLNYSPKVAWLTNSVTHSPTLPYLLSSSGISDLILTNLHFSWQRYLTEYQYTDFIWVQDWDTDKRAPTSLNTALNRIGNNRYSKHSVLVHYLQFNSAGYQACGPQGDICGREFNYADSDNNQDINMFNVKEKSEQLLEQYSKTGTTSVHNVVIVPLGGPDQYKYQSEFDFQYNNYQKIMDFVNLNQDIYKATIEFGTSKNYFDSIFTRRNNFPTVKGDFLNFADCNDGSVAYWTSFFSLRSSFKILLRRLQSNLRSTEILFSFALNFNALKVSSFNNAKLYERLLDVRETVARLQDRHVVSGTLTTRALRYAYNIILKTIKQCWYIQEASISLLSSKQMLNDTYLEKYVYREGEFISSFKSVAPGDQIYLFNSFNHERTEVLHLITRHPNVQIYDHIKNEVLIQITPVWKYTYETGIKISSQFFKIVFVATIPPMTLQLFKIKDGQKGIHNVATIYCIACSIDEIVTAPAFPFVVRPIEVGDIQLESYKHRLIIDEHTGLLKSVTEKSTNNENIVLIEYGEFSNANMHSGMFFTNRNISNYIEDILLPYKLGAKTKAIIIVSGQISTELTTVYGTVLQHTVKIFNLVNNPLSEAIKLETKVNHEISSKSKELDFFLAIQTDIENGNPQEFFIDNNGFQWTPRTINMSKRIESNIYPFTSMAYIQDNKSRMTIITESPQGITALQEGQFVLMLDRRILYDEIASDDNSAIHYTHYILLENLIETNDNDDNVNTKSNIKLPSQLAIYMANSLDYPLDIYFIDINKSHFCHYAFLPLIKTTFPCDIMLINYRVVLNREIPIKYTPNTALMTLLKRRFCCLVKPSTNYVHCSENKPFRLDTLIRNVKAVYQTNLVGTNEGVAINYLNNNNFPPMELTTLRLYF